MSTAVVVLFTLLAYFVDAITSVELCPKSCSCNVTSSGSHLSVDCGHRSLEADQLCGQLDSMLSGEHFRKRLESLSIANTPLTRVPASVCQLLKLTSLSIEHNRITELPDNCFTKITNLFSLSLKWNSIIGLQDGLFDGLQSLNYLDLSWNQISHIGLRVFSNASDLTSLWSLELSHNKLTSLEPWWYYRCLHGIGVHIYLGDNSISKFTNELKLDFQCGMQRPSGYLDLSFNSITHIMDILQGWNIADFTTYICLFNFQGSNRLMKYYFEGDSYDCDCIDFPVYRFAKAWPRTKLLQGVYCNAQKFQSHYLQDALANAIPLSEFVCELSDHCPSSCRCVYRPANSTLHVYCSSANISSLPLHLPPLPKSYVKYKLDFSNNKLLRRLEHRPYFVNASILDVSNCAIDNIDINVWHTLAAMRSPFITSHIYLHNNEIKSLPFALTGIDGSSVIFTLYNNPWDCSCGNRWMIAWFKSLSLAPSNGGNVSCASPSRLKGRSIVQSTEDDFCVDPTMRMLSILLPSVLCPVFISLLIGFAVYRLRVRLYRRYKFHPFDRDECVGEDMDFDVFLCCSSEDHNPHALRILELLESSGYRVCYHLRDFLAGIAIADNMMQSIKRSRRTLCLVSRSFLARYSSRLISCVRVIFYRFQ